MKEMLHHARAVARGAEDQLLIGDMPFGSYHASEAQAIGNAVALVKAGMHAVKLEGGGRIAPIAGALTERGIPVVGHLGLVPQFVNLLGGYRVQGREAAAAARIKEDALALQDAGAFAVVLEGLPRDLALEVTEGLEIPTIGVGAGPGCDAQVLVTSDILGLTRTPLPKFAKKYADLGDSAMQAITRFRIDVEEGRFPDDEHSYH
jgi:3-methyl-2-oxobutanoate hydroxymethyltransferase